ESETEEEDVDLTNIIRGGTNGERESSSSHSLPQDQDQGSSQFVEQTLPSQFVDLFESQENESLAELLS
ncbi:hypothetical protein M422DRAFT_785905, partial [Sphaerobolus stellatus SS14]